MAGAERAWHEELARWTLADLAFVPGSEDHQQMSGWLSRVLSQAG
jgi:hypothetical protein